MISGTQIVGKILERSCTAAYQTRTIIPIVTANDTANITSYQNCAHHQTTQGFLFGDEFVNGAPE